MATNFQNVAVDCMLARNALSRNFSCTGSRWTCGSSDSGAPKAQPPMSDGRFLKKAIKTNMMIPPTTPIEKKVVCQETPAIRTLTMIAITAGPSPWDACSSPTP